MNRPQAQANLVAAHSRLIGVADAFPELGPTLDTAIKNIVQAGEILVSGLELDACNGCCCTVEDSECPTGGEC